MKIRRIVGTSMEPAFHEGEVVLFMRVNNYSIGDVVMANVEGREIVKRISGMTQDKVYLLGDNQSSSTDSRVFGSIPIKQVAGKAMYKIPFIAKRQ